MGDAYHGEGLSELNITGMLFVINCGLTVATQQQRVYVRSSKVRCMQH